MAKFNKQLIFPIVLLVAFAVIAGGTYYIKKNPNLFEKKLTAEQAGQAAVDYANKYLLSGGPKATFAGASEENGVYAFKLKIDDQEYTSYVTKNGKMMFVSGIPLTAPEEQTPDVAKADKPDVKLFVMSYCPYGLQAEKMYLPVYNLLKNDADMGIYFVNYAMHGKKEIDENLRQYCIQKEQNDKYADYLQCFTTSKDPGNGEADYSTCLTKAGVDKTKLASCIAQADKQFNVTKDYNDKTSYVSGQFPKVEINNDLNEKYGVQGSPTLIINDKEVNLNDRSPNAFFKAVCSAFNNSPAVCSQSLSSDQPAPGFGEGTASTASGGCAN